MFNEPSKGSVEWELISWIISQPPHHIELPLSIIL